MENDMCMTIKESGNSNNEQLNLNFNDIMHDVTTYGPGLVKGGIDFAAKHPGDAALAVAGGCLVGAAVVASVPEVTGVAMAAGLTAIAGGIGHAVVDGLNKGEFNDVLPKVTLQKNANNGK